MIPSFLFVMTGFFCSHRLDRGHMFTSFRVPSGIYTLYVETIGNRYDPACILIPGAMQGAWGFSDRFCMRIAEQGFFVVRFDHRDIGRSTLTPPSAKEYSLADLGEDV